MSCAKYQGHRDAKTLVYPPPTPKNTRVQGQLEHITFTALIGIKTGSCGKLEEGVTNLT